MAITPKFVCTDLAEFATLNAAIAHEATTGPYSIRACIAPGTLSGGDYSAATVAVDGDGNARVTFSDGSYIVFSGSIVYAYSSAGVVSGQYIRDRNLMG